MGFERSVLAIVSALALGTLCGWLTGRGDSDPTIIAAAIPAILSLAGAIVFARTVGGEESRSAGYGTLFILVFCVAFAWAVIRSVDLRDAAEERSIVESLKRQIDFAFECSETQSFLNKYRASLDVEPLSFAEVCRLAQ